MRILLTLVCTAVLAACNTIEGIGQDIKAGGAAIERAAEKNKR